MSDKTKDTGKWVTNYDEDGRPFLFNPETGETKRAHFGMIDDKVVPEIRQLIKVSPASAELLFFFIEKMNRRNEVKHTQTELQEESGLSRSSIHRALKALETYGFISKFKKGKENRYYVNDAVYWYGKQNERSSKSKCSSQIKVTPSLIKDGK